MFLKHLLVTSLSLITALGLLLIPKPSAEVKKTDQMDQKEEEEISPYMGELQRFSQKLGYAVNAGNLRLSEFYREEIGEVLAELKEVEEHDGFPIGDTVKVIMDPIMKDFHSAIERRDTKAVQAQYLTLIEGCNRCHAATEHEFIEITPAAGTPPFNQKF